MVAAILMESDMMLSDELLNMIIDKVSNLESSLLVMNHIW